MAERIRQRLTYANVMSTIACFVALATGTAYAANTVFSADIVDGEVKAVDLGTGAVTNVKLADGAIGKSKISAGAVENGKIGDGAVGQSKLANGAVVNTKIADGAVNSQKIGNDTVTGVDVNESSLTGEAIPGTTARAYGLVASDGVVSNAKNLIGNATALSGVGPPTGGTYCIQLADSIDATSAVIVPETNYAVDGTVTPASLGWAKGNAGACGENGVVVQTGTFVGDAADDNAGGDALSLINQPFYFVVP